MPCECLNDAEANVLNTIPHNYHRQNGKLI